MSFGGSTRTDRDAADARALARVQSGDVGAIADLYDRYSATAMGIAMRILRNSEEAEDTVHDTFMTIVERAHQFHPERGTVAAWLLTTVRNLALDKTRRSSRRTQIAETELKHEVGRSLLGQSAEELLATEHERAAVRKALERLPEAQRQTLMVAFFEGLSYPEIAERDAIALGTVKSRAARAIHALRCVFEEAEAKDDSPPASESQSDGPVSS